MDLIDIDILIEKMEVASTKEMCLIKEIFKTVYKASNINEFFLNDREKIEKFKEAIKKMNVTGINKSIAKESLEDYLDDIIKRLKKDINYI